jgi:hypothetical protein
MTPNTTAILPRPTAIQEARGGMGAILFGAFRVGWTRQIAETGE